MFFSLLTESSISSHKSFSKMDSLTCINACVLCLLSSAVYQADPVRKVGSRLQDCGHGAGGSNRNPPWQQEKVPASNQAGSDAGQSAVPDDADAEAAGRRLRRPQPQVTRTPCESIFTLKSISLGWINIRVIIRTWVSIMQTHNAEYVPICWSTVWQKTQFWSL